MTEQPSHGNDLPQVIEKVDVGKLKHFVTSVKTAEQQVGEHIIRALQYDGTVAVLTTVVMGQDGQQRVVSAALNPNMMTQVKQVLEKATKERQQEEPCIGFHCLVKPKEEDKQSNESQSDEPTN